MKLSDLFRTSKQGKSSAFIQFWNNLRKRVRRSRVSEKPRLSTADKPLKDTASANSSGRQVVDKPEKKAVSPEVHRELADDSRSDVTVVPVDNTDSQSAVIEETDSKNDELRRFDTDESSGKQG